MFAQSQVLTRCFALSNERSVFTHIKKIIYSVIINMFMYNILRKELWRLNVLGVNYCLCEVVFFIIRKTIFLRYSTVNDLSHLTSSLFKFI